MLDDHLREQGRAPMPRAGEARQDALRWVFGQPAVSLERLAEAAQVSVYQGWRCLGPCPERSLHLWLSRSADDERAAALRACAELIDDVALGPAPPPITGSGVTGLLGQAQGNVEALEAVVSDGREAGVDQWLGLGEFVGFGADPGPCLDIAAELGVTSVKGELDHQLATRRVRTIPDPSLRLEVAQLRDWLSDRQVGWIAGLADELEVGRLHLGSAAGCRWLEDVMINEWVGLAEEVIAELELLVPRDVTTIGGHRAVVITQDGGLCDASEIGEAIVLRPDRRYLVCPGSVGWPHDGAPGACYALVEGRQLRFRRVGYDIWRTCRKLRDRGDVAGVRGLAGGFRPRR